MLPTAKGFWNHRRRRFPEVIVDSGKAAVDAAKNPIDTLKDGYNAAKNKAGCLISLHSLLTVHCCFADAVMQHREAEWLKNNAISTVEQAVAILSQGFSNFGASCPNSAAPSIRAFSWHELKIYFGDLRCKISLMGQDTPLFGLNFGEHRIAVPGQLQVLAHVGWELQTTCHGTHNHIEVTKCLARSLAKFSPPVDFLPDPLQKVANGQVLDLLPDPVRLVAGSAYEAVRTVFSVGWELMHCPHRGHHHQLIQCLGGWIQHLAPAVHWMAAPLQLVAGSAYEAVRTVFSVGWELMHCPHRGHHHHLIQCLGGWIQHLAPAVHWMAAPLQLVAGSAYEAVRTVFSVGWELMHCPDTGHHHHLIQCLGGWIQHLAPAVHWMAAPLQAIASGDIMGLLPGQLNDIARGDIMKLLPKQFDDIASGDIMGLLPGQLNDIARGDIMKLLPKQFDDIASGNITGLMPGPLQLLGGGQTNSIQNMLTLGNALMECSDSQQKDLVQCLGFQIVGRVPPLNFLNRLGDIFGEFIAAFAKVASTVAAQAMKGGESLLQTAATTEFPSAGAQAMVHHRGQELTTPN